MAIVPVSAILVREIVRKFELKGLCLCLGKQDINLSRAQLESVLNGDLEAIDLTASSGVSDRDLLLGLGFETLLSVDVSDFEGAEILFDMNQPGLVQVLPRLADFIVETGTAEHVFHVPNYLANVCESLKVGGVAMHFIPCNNAVDHGFYQFSPTLFLDFYSSNKFELLDIVLLETDSYDWSRVRLTRYDPGCLDRRDKDLFAGRYVSLAVVVRKTNLSTSTAIPQQGQYMNMSGWLEEDSAARDDWIENEISLKGPFEHHEGFCWKFSLSDKIGAGNDVQNNRRSRVILCEDDSMLANRHAMHEDVINLGLGRYSHWGDELLFAASDNSDPNTNERTYKVKVLKGIQGALPVESLKTRQLLTGWRRRLRRLSGD